MKNYQVLKKAERVLMIFILIELVAFGFNFWLEFTNLMAYVYNNATNDNATKVLIVTNVSLVSICMIWTIIAMLIQCKVNEIWSKPTEVYMVFIVILNILVLSIRGYLSWRMNVLQWGELTSVGVTSLATIIAEFTLVKISHVSRPRKFSLEVDRFQNPLIAK